MSEATKFVHPLMFAIKRIRIGGDDARARDLRQRRSGGAGVGLDYAYLHFQPSV